MVVGAPEAGIAPELEATFVVEEEEEVDFFTLRFELLVAAEICEEVVEVLELEVAEEVTFSLSDDFVMTVVLVDAGVRFEDDDLVERLGVAVGEAEELEEVTEVSRV